MTKYNVSNAVEELKHPPKEKVCRRYLYVYPRCIKFYIEAYREIWEDESKEVKDFK